MIRSRTLCITVKKNTGDAFDAILRIPPKMMPDAKLNDDGWWSFTGPHGKSKLKFNENRDFGILDHNYEDEESVWNVPMRIVSSGDYSEVMITLNKPSQLSDKQFDQRMSEIGQMVDSMKNIIESGS